MAECNWDPKKHGGKECPVHHGGSSDANKNKVRIHNGQHQVSVDGGKTWEESSAEEYKELKQGGYGDFDFDENNEDDFGFDDEEEYDEEEYDLIYYSNELINLAKKDGMELSVDDAIDLLEAKNYEPDYLSIEDFYSSLSIEDLYNSLNWGEELKNNGFRMPGDGDLGKDAKAYDIPKDLEDKMDDFEDKPLKKYNVNYVYNGTKYNRAVEANSREEAMDKIAKENKKYYNIWTEPDKESKMSQLVETAKKNGQTPQQVLDSVSYDMDIEPGSEDFKKLKEIVMKDAKMKNGAYQFNNDGQELKGDGPADNIMKGQAYGTLNIKKNKDGSITINGSDGDIDQFMEFYNKYRNKK